MTVQHALRALSVLASLPDGAFVLGRDLAKQARIPANYLLKILWTLGSAGVVEAARGSGGGYRYQATEQDALRAASELKNPLDPRKAKERGAVVYQNFCTPCHGGALRGDGAVALHGYPAPPNLRGEKSMKLAEGQMFHILTFGQKKMPSYASQLTADDRWNVIDYVRSLQNEAPK